MARSRAIWNTTLENKLPLVPSSLDRSGSMDFSADFSDKILKFIVGGGNSDEERRDLIGILGLAATPESIELLLRAHTTLSDAGLKEATSRSLARTGDLWGDGEFHEARSIPLERAWGTAEDPDFLVSCAVAIGKIGRPDGIQMLLDAVLSTDPNKEMRRRAALVGLGKIYTPNAVPPLADLLTTHPTLDPESQLAATILARIGDAAASEALVQWSKNADSRAAPFVGGILRGAGGRELRKAFAAALREGVHFRDDTVQQAIDAALNSKPGGSGG